jgi:electron transfer flavoprotein alpha subunit
MIAGTLQHAGQPVEILVFVDLSGEELGDHDKGILSQASRLAKKIAGTWTVLGFSAADGCSIDSLAPYSVEQLTLIDGPENLFDSLELQGKLIAAAANEMGAALVLLPHNDLGNSLAPLLAAELNAALFVEAIACDAENDRLKLTRQILGAQVAEAKSWDGQKPLVLTINPRVLSGVVLPSMKPGKVEVHHWQPANLPASGATRIVERIPPDPQTVDVSEAEVMVSAGLGCDQQGFAQVEELSRLINASLGVTRPAYDLGYTGFERMVGQTGKTVAPRFYLALGISGSMHHLGGMKDSKRIVAVNIDSKAPIIPNADECFIADLREVMPLLIERVKSAAGGVA